MNNKMILDLQNVLGVSTTGEFDEETIEKAVARSKDKDVILWVQKFLNSLDHSFKVGKIKFYSDNSFMIILSGEYDKETRELLTYFQKEYWEYKRIPVTAELDRETWELISAYMKAN